MLHAISVLIIGAVIGAAAGAIANKGKVMGWIANILAGLIGAAMGEAVLGDWGPNISGIAILPSIIGAVVVILIISLFAKKISE